MNNIPLAIMEQIKPVFQDLCDTELLSRCVRGYTQNVSESFHVKVWKSQTRFCTVNISKAFCEL